MEQLSFLILLLYYDRPNMVKSALKSIKDLKYSNWKLAFIDDGSSVPGRPIVEKILADHVSKIVFKNSNDSIDDKCKRGGSRIGQLMNEALLESNCDVAIMLCDDDALVSDYFLNLNDWFLANPNKKYCYSNVIFFNPFVETPTKLLDQPFINYENVKINRFKHFLNKDGRTVKPSNCLDASQVAWRISCNTEGKVWFPFPQTKSLDATFYEKLYQTYGFCEFAKCLGQYKAYFSNSLTARTPPAGGRQPKMYTIIDSKIEQDE